MSYFEKHSSPGSTKTSKRRIRITTRGVDPAWTTASSLFPYKDHGMFSSYSRDENFLSLLALPTCFPIFPLEVCPFPAVGHPSWKHSQISGGFQRNVQLTPGTQSLRKIFTKDPQWLTFKKTHMTHKLSPPLNQKFIVSNPVVPRWGTQGTHFSVPQEPAHWP